MDFHGARDQWLCVFVYEVDGTTEAAVARRPMIFSEIYIGQVTLADFRRNDALLKRLPRVSPDPALRERIFTSPEILELTGAFDVPDTFEGSNDRPVEWTVPKLPVNSPRRDTPGRPHLVAIPGGRSTVPTSSVRPVVPPRKRRNTKSLRILIAALAVMMPILAAQKSLAAWMPELGGMTGLYLFSPT